MKENINKVRIEKNLLPLENSRDLYCADRVCLADPVALIERNVSLPLPDEYRACGACFWEMQGQLQPELSSLSDILLISLGSTGLSDLGRDFIHAIRQKCDAKSSVLVGNLAADLSTEIGVDVAVKRAPLADLFTKSCLVVTQGGAGSTYQALSYGVPVIIYPSHRNHRILGEILESAGVGILINGSDDLYKLDLFDIDSSSRIANEYKKDMEVENGVDAVVKSILELI